VIRRSTTGLNPINMFPGDLVLREDLEGRNILLFLGWDSKDHGRARIFDFHGDRFFWFDKKSKVDLWWIIGVKNETPG